MLKSPHITQALVVAMAAGNSVKEVSDEWSKVEQIVHMSSSLTADVRQDIEKKRAVVEVLVNYQNTT